VNINQNKNAFVWNITPESTSFDIYVTVNRLCMFYAFVYCIWYNKYEFNFIFHERYCIVYLVVLLYV